MTDTAGLLLAVEVTAANEQDHAVLPRLLEAAKKHCPDIAKVWADKGYTGPATRELAAKTGIDIEIVSGPKPPPGAGFLVQPRRWVVERTHAWINATGAWSANGKPPSKPTPGSSSSARSRSC